MAIDEAPRTPSTSYVGAVSFSDVGVWHPPMMNALPGPHSHQQQHQQQQQKLALVGKVWNHLTVCSRCGSMTKCVNQT